MSLRGFLFLSVVTLALIVGAVVSYPEATTSAPEPGPRFFPSLDPEAVNKVDRIAVTTKGETFTIEREGKNWVVKDKGGYPAEFSKVKEALVSVANLRRFEQKTDNPDLLHKLDLEAPDKKGASSSRLKIASGGKTVADLIVGKSNNKDILFGRSLVYVRLPDSNQAWLAIGDPKLADSALGWIDKSLFDVKPDRIARVVQTGPDGGRIEIAEDTPSDSKLALVNKPEGREIKDQRFLRYIVEGLQDLSLEDVKPASEVDFGKDPAGTAVFRTFDGLVVTVRLATQGEGKDATTWATIEAGVDPDTLRGKAPEKGSALKAADVVRKEAKAINAKVEGWAFKLGSTVTRFMTYKLEDVLKPAAKKPEPKAPADKKSEEEPPAKPAPTAADQPKPDSPATPGKANTPTPETEPGDTTDTPTKTPETQD